MLGYGPAIAEILVSLWDRFEDIPLEAVPPGRLSMLVVPTVTTTVPIEGNWNGVVIVTTAAELAWRLTMLHHGTEEPTDDEIIAILTALSTDLAREFTVMLPGPCRVGDATVKGTDGFRALLPGYAEVLSEDFRSAGAGLGVAVLQRVAAPVTG